MSTRWPTEPIEEALKAGGFTLRRSKKHLVYENAEGRTVTLPSTPSDRRTEENVLAAIRRALQPGTEPKEDVDAIIPKQHKKKTGMAGGTKSHGTGFAYITIWQPQPPPISDTERKELRSLLDRPAKFHSVFVRSMLRLIERGNCGGEKLIDAASRPEYIEDLVDLIMKSVDAGTPVGMDDDDRFVAEYILQVHKDLLDEVGRVPHKQFLESLPIVLREYGYARRSEEVRREKLFVKMFHEIAKRILREASAADIHDYLLQKEDVLRGTGPLLFEAIERTAASIVASE